ncbi:VLRF1 family aeRF1-type release factor [Salinithrix halophila]|uniref:VLRF1 family aeRF1-type release factor n=1 Tax=Salinithrix halophila TaxID=1485204 RepID=A0ABV8JFA4_9BACL
MAFADTLNQLEDVQGEGPRKILSLYLNTDRSSPEQQAGEWKIRLKNGLKRLEEAIGKSGSPDEQQAFSSLKKHVNKEVLEREPQMEKGLLLFANPDRSVWQVHILSVPVETEFRWEEKAVLEPFYELTNRYPLTGIILVQNQSVRVIATEMGTILSSDQYEWDPEAEDWKKHEGPHKADASMGSGNNTKRDKYDDRYQAIQQRWLKSLAPRIDRFAKRHHWQRIILTGEKGATRELENHLHLQANKILDKNLANRKDHEIVAALAS